MCLLHGHLINSFGCSRTKSENSDRFGKNLAQGSPLYQQQQNQSHANDSTT